MSLGVVPLRPQKSDVVIVGRLANAKVGLQRFRGRQRIDLHRSQILGGAEFWASGLEFRSLILEIFLFGIPILWEIQSFLWLRGITRLRQNSG